MLRRTLSNAAWTLLLLFQGFVVKAQDHKIEFGQVTAEEANMKECAFDKNAEAVVLLDYGMAYFNEEHHLITERRVRLKILKEKGISRGNIRIPYYSNDGFESIVGIEGLVITPTGNGEYTTTALERKNIFNQKINSLYSIQSFALPNVKVGSILDYKYRSVMKSYGGLKQWEFQKEIPVVTSYYELAPLANSEFAYSVYKLPEMAIDIQPDKSAGKVQFMMKNVPGLRDEVFATTTRSYLQRVNFQFSAYTNYFGKNSYTNTWQALTDELLKERSFGSQANKDLSETPFLKSLSPSLRPVDKLEAIYAFVRNNITWNEIYSKYSEAGVKSTLEDKKGNAGEINLLLVSLLKSAGLETYPLLVSERDHGLVDTTYSYLDQFNKVVAIAFVDGKRYVLDGTDKITPFFLVPSDLLNTTAFLVDKKKKGFVYFNNLPQKQREVVTLNGTVNENGRLQANAKISGLDYAKMGKVQRFRKEKARYLEALLREHPNLHVDSFQLEGLDRDSAYLHQEIDFTANLKQTGGYHLLEYNFFTGLQENPFITQYRFTDIDFGTQYSLVLTTSFSLPPNLAPESLPANKKMVSTDRSMAVSRIIEKAGNKVNVRVTVDINRERYLSWEYEDVKGFFKEMVDLVNEPILLKTK